MIIDFEAAKFQEDEEYTKSKPEEAIISPGSLQIHLEEDAMGISPKFRPTRIG